jgi:geranylgeranyl diphosphate synthase type I
MLPFLAVGADHNLDGALRGALSTCLARHAAQTVRGQSLEMDLLTLSLVQPGPYLRAVAGKTGGLFALPVEGSALIAGLSPQEAEAIGEAFSQLGVLFQLQDDVLDLWGDKGRGRKGVDLEEGKVSALVVAHLERCPEDTESLLDLLRTPRERCPRARVDEFIARFEQSGARDDVMAQIRHLREAVISAPALARHPGLRELAGELVMVACAPLAHLPGAPARGF